MWRVGESSAVTSRCRATVARSSCAIRSPPRDPHISSSTFRLRRIVDEPGGPQLPRFARCCYHPWTPTSPPRRSAGGGSSTSQGVRSCLASLVAATTPGPPHLLLDVPPAADRRRARGSAAASLRSLLLPPLDPHISSSTFRLRRIVDEPGGPQLPRFARCCYHPWTPISPPSHRLEAWVADSVRTAPPGCAVPVEPRWWSRGRPVPPCRSPRTSGDRQERLPRTMRWVAGGGCPRSRSCRRRESGSTGIPRRLNERFQTA